MKESNASIKGGSNGSLGGATTADLKQGYMKQDDKLPSDYCDEDEESFLDELYEKPDGGFVGRPKGFER